MVSIDEFLNNFFQLMTSIKIMTKESISNENL